MAEVVRRTWNRRLTSETVMAAPPTRRILPDPWTEVDPVTEVLHDLRMNGVFYCRSEFSAPWGLALLAA
jgi:hypothetical protein